MEKRRRRRKWHVYVAHIKRITIWGLQFEDRKKRRKERKRNKNWSQWEAEGINIKNNPIIDHRFSIQWSTSSLLLIFDFFCQYFMGNWEKLGWKMSKCLLKKSQNILSYYARRFERGGKGLNFIFPIKKSHKKAF